MSFKNELEDEYLDNSFDNQIEEDMQVSIKKLEKTYEILQHIQCSALTGDSVKNVFDVAILYMLKKKSILTEMFKSEQPDLNKKEEKPKKESKGFFGRKKSVPKAPAKVTKAKK